MNTVTHRRTGEAAGHREFEVILTDDLSLAKDAPWAYICLDDMDLK